jgi:hypothetical protein
MTSGFTDKVIKIVGESHYQQHKHMLEALHPAHEDRCVHTLNLGFDIPQTAGHIERAGKLPDLNYRRYIKFMRAQLNPSVC